MLVLPLISTALTVASLATAAQMWWKGTGSVLGRVYYSVVALQGILFVLFLNHWNFIGFRFG